MRTLPIQINNGIKGKLITTDRLNRLLLAEDWKRVCSNPIQKRRISVIDFDTLRRTMINIHGIHRRFNDYIESSEYQH